MIPGDDGDAISEQPVYDDAALLAASFTNAEKEEGDMVLEEMKRTTYRGGHGKMKIVLEAVFHDIFTHQLGGCQLDQHH